MDRMPCPEQDDQLHLIIVSYRTRIMETARNPFLWGGLALLILVSSVIYVMFNSWLMPVYTRHGVSVQVPDVMDDSVSVATRILEEAGLTAETQVFRKSNLPRDVVIDQNPSPQSAVKPGRRIYLTVNTGDTTTVLVPKVKGLTVRQASNEMNFLDLAVVEVLPDSIPSPHRGSVTMQRPEAGERVSPGTEVRLWFSQGLGTKRVAVPDVTGMTVEEARTYLLTMKLRSVVLGAPTSDDAEIQVESQSPDPGTSVYEGYQVRLTISLPANGADASSDGKP